MTLPIAGIQCISALTTTFIDSHLEIALNGLNARRVLNDRNEVAPEAFAPIPIHEMATIIKSRIVQNSVKYDHIPKPIHFINISIVNKIAKISSRHDKISLNLAFFPEWSDLSSRVKQMVDAAIKNKMKYSK